MFQNPIVFILLFGISGFAGLIYESIWAQYLKIILGHSAYAQLLVLIIFMGGMALGAWLVAQYSHRLKNLLKIYALVELCLGFLGIYFHSIFVHLNSFVQETLLGSAESSLFMNFSFWFLGALLILPQSMLLGGTFPLMTNACLRRFKEKSGSLIARLYFINSLGGALGVLFSGFFLIEQFGLPGTVLCAGSFNIVIALAAWLLSARQDEPQFVASKAVDSTDATSTLFSPKVLLLASLVTGLSSFIYEIVWIRMLSMVLGSSSHAFEIMLSAFIFGLAFGSFFINKMINKLKDPIRTLGYIQISMGCLALLTIPAYNFTFDLMATFLHSIPKTAMGYVVLNGLLYSLCLLFMLPATLCAGMTLPLITNILFQKNYGEQSVGRVYAVNTMGAIVGAILAQLWFMPAFGLKASLGLGALTDLVLGLGILWLVLPSVPQISFAVASSVSLVLSLVILGFVQLSPLRMASGVFRQGTILSSDKHKVVYHQDGKTATISVLAWAQNLAINTNGKTDASLSLQGPPGRDESTQVLLPLISYSLFPEAKQVAVIGLGSGMSSHMFLSVPTIEAVDTIEIEPAVVNGAKLFGDRVKLTFEDKRSHIIFQDARSYFLRTKKQYDLIMSEPSNPWVSGVSSLFTEEFYQVVQKNLSPKGVFAQWINLYDLSPEMIASIIKAIGKHFPDYSLYLTDNTDLLIIASKENQERNPSGAPFEIPNLRYALERVYVKNVDDLLFHRIGNRKTLDPFFNSFNIQANSDYFPVLDIHANKNRFLGAASNLMDLKSSPMPLSWLIDDNAINPERITQNPSFSLTYRVERALRLYKTWVENPFITAYDPNSHFILSELQNNHALCQGLVGEDAWLNALKALMEFTVPYLTKEQMVAMWDKVKTNPCLAKSSERVQVWVRLYEGLVYRDFAGISAASSLLLTRSDAVADRPLALGFSLLANLKLKAPEKAWHDWSIYSPQIQAHLQLRFLAALAAQQGASKPLF